MRTHLVYFRQPGDLLQVAVMLGSGHRRSKVKADTRPQSLNPGFGRTAVAACGQSLSKSCIQVVHKEVILLLSPWRSFFLRNETQRLGARVCLFARMKRRHLGARNCRVVCSVVPMKDRHTPLLKTVQHLQRFTVRNCLAPQLLSGLTISRP